MTTSAVSPSWIRFTVVPALANAIRFFYNADGELLIVPQQGLLAIATELGMLTVQPGEMCLLPRGLKLRVELLDGSARGYISENYGAHFKLPDLGPIGA